MHRWLRFNFVTMNILFMVALTFFAYRGVGKEWVYASSLGLIGLLFLVDRILSQHFLMIRRIRKAAEKSLKECPDCPSKLDLELSGCTPIPLFASPCEHPGCWHVCVHNETEDGLTLYIGMPNGDRIFFGCKLPE